MSRFKKFVLIVMGAVLVSGSAAYATAKPDFYPEAAAWSYQFCRTVSPTNREQNTICFLLAMQAQNQIRWALQNNNNATQQAEIDALESNVSNIALNKTNVYTTTGDELLSTTETQYSEAFCDDDNDIVLSGGYTSFPDKKMHVVSSQQGDESTGTSSWVVGAFGENPNDFAFQAYASCYSVE